MDYRGLDIYDYHDLVEAGEVVLLNYRQPTLTPEEYAKAIRDNYEFIHYTLIYKRIPVDIFMVEPTPDFMEVVVSYLNYENYTYNDSRFNVSPKYDKEENERINKRISDALVVLKKYQTAEYQCLIDNNLIIEDPVFTKKEGKPLLKKTKLPSVAKKDRWQRGAEPRFTSIAKARRIQQQVQTTKKPRSHQTHHFKGYTETQWWKEYRKEYIKYFNDIGIPEYKAKKILNSLDLI